MIYNRGNPRDFDRWAQVTGDARWNYENVEKYFHKIEDYNGYWSRSGYHGKGGPLSIESVNYAPGLNYVLDAAKEMGFEIRDLNQDQKQGFSPLDFTQKRGARFSTYRAYIKPALHRQNLVIFRYSLVTKIHFDEALRAVGVTFVRHGVKGYAHANKEIIVSGGAINSPHLLMLSGVGPRDHLIEHRIPPIVDLPVGLNLQDHVSTIIGPFVINTTDSFILHRDLDVGALFNYAKDGKGPLSSPMGAMAVGLVSTSFAQSPSWPDIIYTIPSLGVFSGLAELLESRFNAQNVKNFLTPVLGEDSHFVMVSLGLPKSRGHIRLKDRNPLSKPLIDPRYYSDIENQDFKAMVEGTSLILRLYENTTSLQKINAHLSHPYPGCDNVLFKSTAYIECLVKTFTGTLFHPSGTCAMGKVEDASTVVDSQLRVKGVTGLRVADTSIMPFVTNANTNAPTIVIGEMCADMIKSDWNIG
ncbi:unnamed protein product [Orchesella dallaii]|uniref:Glucose-methanol-choline oxidoreductase N-terminal domain-containing protein n=1 Tax=Orchesella dallaii TaxID=48710 RepID=A0ABP1QBN8_9HEXA